MDSIVSIPRKKLIEGLIAQPATGSDAFLGWLQDWVANLPSLQPAKLL